MSTVTLTWVDPTTLVDGSAIPPNDFADVEIFMSADGGLTYTNAGHVGPGTQRFEIEISDPGTFNFKLNCKDTQTPPLFGPDSAVVSVTIAAPPLAPISAPTNVQFTVA
jgi:hypothetical protein